MLAKILMKAFEFGWGADKHRRPQRTKYRNLVYLIIDHKIQSFHEGEKLFPTRPTGGEVCSTRLCPLTTIIRKEYAT